ncbi:S1C family serine protease [Pleionea litopenaei]|uniref:Trypsin-like peptidase domain-containing protein n=1 Tax=Pleionea litopenaei TaxID=3070815 RepID=A0AA51RTD3_9GAMM|nr:trypsin-like peptidase domain-containing protein [Pleionea sp. HL-JVS1]WMS87124.1 trypsin-like peptidase domain-containing protein [Pleionea sp. HL-JVS1]
MKFWFKYISIGLIAALVYLLLWSDAPVSFELRQWLANRLVFSVQPQPTLEPKIDSVLQASYADEIAQTAAAVVSIQTVFNKGTLSKNPNPTSLDDQYLVNVGLNVGSGVIIDSRGYVVTNYHVIHNADSIKVQLSDGRQKIASVIGSDPNTDLALLFIDLENLPTPRTNEQRQVRAGDIVFAIGNPYGQFDQTVTMGIVSATRSVRTDFPIYQIDAAIHPGNSGGALINAYGELIGITAQQLATRNESAAQTGIGFSIPYPVVKSIVDDLMDDGKISRAWVGFRGGILNERGHQAFAPPQSNFGEGIAVTSVEAGGPAATAGLEPGDFITHINDILITSPNQAFEIISNAKPGDSMNFTLFRQKEEMHLSLTVSEAPRVRQ